MPPFQPFRVQSAIRSSILGNGQNSRLQQSRPLLFEKRLSQLFHTKPSISPRQLSPSHVPNVRSLVLRRFRQIRENSTQGRPQPDVTPHLGSPEPSLSLSQRMRKLSREYGWSALGVYLALSALDFPFCFLAVRLLGTDRIGHWEHVIVSTFKDLISVPFPQLFPKEGAPATTVEGVASKSAEVADGWGVDEATEKASKDDATIWTQLVLAYAIHKSFIFIRVPVTAAVTPKVVKVLRGWGWDIGKRKPKTGALTGKSD